MATYQELFELSSERDILIKVAMAAVIKAESLVSAGTPTTAEITWANKTLSNPSNRAKTLINYVLAANESSTAAQIRSATDATIQTNVDAAVDKMISGGVE